MLCYNIPASLRYRNEVKVCPLEVSRLSKVDKWLSCFVRFLCWVSMVSYDSHDDSV